MSASRNVERKLDGELHEVDVAGLDVFDEAGVAAEFFIELGRRELGCGSKHVHVLARGERHDEVLVVGVVETQQCVDGETKHGAIQECPANRHGRGRFLSERLDVFRLFAGVRRGIIVLVRIQTNPGALNASVHAHVVALRCGCVV